MFNWKCEAMQPRKRKRKAEKKLCELNLRDVNNSLRYVILYLIFKHESVKSIENDFSFSEQKKRKEKNQMDFKRLSFRQEKIFESFITRL